MNKSIFNKIYKRGLKKIRVNRAHRKALKKELGFGFHWTDLLRFRVMVPGAIAILVMLVAGPVFVMPHVRPAYYRTVAMLEPGTDDWQYSFNSPGKSFGMSLPTPSSSGGALGLGASGIGMGAYTGLSASPSPLSGFMPRKLGLTVGGSQDVVTFRSNIKEGYLPKRSSLTYEGLFSEYFFNSGTTDACDELFCPFYSQAISSDPISGKEDRYLAVGLNSGIDANDFKRKPLDLVIVLDISGSMNAGFSSYYYDKFPVPNPAEIAKNKLDIAVESIVGLMSHLEPEDRFGVVLFGNSAYLAKPMSFVAETNMASIKSHLLELQSRGGTNMSAGMNLGTELYDGLESESGREKRIIFLTDAMPNTGVIGGGELLEMTENNAEKGIHTSFIGIGVDFQTDLVEKITKVKGANYHSVHTADEFMKRMDKNFDFMVTPLVFDLGLKLDAKGYEIEKVYGSPEADESTGQLLKVKTLFPSETDDRGTRGGIIILKLKKLSDNASLTLSAEYADTLGGSHRNTQTVTFSEHKKSYDNSGIRKGVLLSRYADLLGNWIIDELRLKDSRDSEIVPLVNEVRGIRPVPDESSLIDWQLGRWEQGSVPLSVQSEYKDVFRTFSEHMSSEMQVLGDDDLKQELEVLNKLMNF